MIPTLSRRTFGVYHSETASVSFFFCPWGLIISKGASHLKPLISSLPFEPLHLSVLTASNYLFLLSTSISYSDLFSTEEGNNTAIYTRFPCTTSHSFSSQQTSHWVLFLPAVTFESLWLWTRTPFLHTRDISLLSSIRYVRIRREKNGVNLIIRFICIR